MVLRPLRARTLPRATRQRLHVFHPRCFAGNKVSTPTAEALHKKTAQVLQTLRGFLLCVQLRSSVFFFTLVFTLPALAIVERTPPCRLAIHFSLHVLLFGFATVADHCRAAIGVFLRRITQEVVLRIDFVLVRHNFDHQRGTGLTIFRELAGRQEQTEAPSRKM